MALKSTRPPNVAPISEVDVGSARRSHSDVRSASDRVRELELKLLQAEEAMQRERRVANALREVGLALGTTLELDRLLELILQRIVEAVEADRATLYLLDDTREELVSRIVQGDEVRAIRLKVGEGIAGHVAETGKALLVADAYDDPRFNAAWDLTSGYRTRSILAVPMTNHLGTTIGVVQVLNKKGGPFTDSDAVVLAALATQAAISIDNSRLFASVLQKNAELLETKEQLEHRIRDLKLLFDLESAMGRAASLPELFTGVLSEALATCEASAGAFLMVDSGAKSGVGYVMRVGDESTHEQPFELTSAELTRVVQEAETSTVNDLWRAPEPDPVLVSLAGGPPSHMVAVPLEGEDGESIGALVLFNKRRGAGFSDEDSALMLLIAANASTAIRLQRSRESREREARLTTIGRLLSGVIHDLKTPLTVISGYVQLMSNADEREVREEYAELALKQFEHIGSMQRDILEFARGEKTLLIRKVYLVKFFEDVRGQLENDLARMGVELVIDLQDRGTARFDEGKILRVIHNLARNAAEAMAGRGGKFTIKVSREKDDGLLLTFSDNGPGIPKDIQHKLFQSFVTSGKAGGTGLGLAITKRIAEEHHGSISVHSSSRGVTFKLRLPQKEA